MMGRRWWKAKESRGCNLGFPRLNLGFERLCAASQIGALLRWPAEGEQERIQTTATRAELPQVAPADGVNLRESELMLILFHVSKLLATRRRSRIKRSKLKERDRRL